MPLSLLTLDGYNNTVAFNESAPVCNYTPFPDWANQDFIGCVNASIGSSALLITKDASQNLPEERKSIFDKPKLSDEEAYYSSAGRTMDIPMFGLMLLPLLLVLRQLFFGARR